MNVHGLDASRIVKIHNGCSRLAAIVTCLLLAAALAVKARAQDPSAPPKPGDRLRNLGGQLLDGFLKPSGQAPPQQPLDFAKINDAVELILKPILTGDATLDALQLTFDPDRTNLAKDTLRLTTMAGLRRSAWSSEPSRWNSDVTATADLQSPGGAKATIETQIIIATDVAGLANFFLQRHQTRSAATSNTEPAPPPAAAPRPAPGPPAPSTPVPSTPATPALAELPAPTASVSLPKSVGQQLLKEKLLEMPRIATFDDVADAFQMTASVQFLTANEKIEQLKAQVVAATDDVSRAKLTQDLITARRERDKAGDLRTRIVRDDSGKATAIYITLAAPQAMGIAQLERLDLVVQARDIRLAVQAKITKGVELYALVKPIIVGTLERLQNRDPAAIEAQRAMIRGWLPRIRGMLEQGEF